MHRDICLGFWINDGSKHPAPLNSQPGQLGKYLKSCRVKVIDQDEFPSGLYAKETAEDVPMGLFIEYVKLAPWVKLLSHGKAWNCDRLTTGIP